MNDTTEQFLNKLDTFAEGLEPTEQAMLAYLIADDRGDDVAGFDFYEAWPSRVADIAPIKIGSLRADAGTILSSGHTTGLVSPVPDHGRF